MDVPDALQDSPNWILWKDEDGRKVPYQISGAKAKSNDPATWTTYERASLSAMGFTGLGYVFDGTGLFGVDLDGCITDDGTIQPWAQEIIDDFKTFAEYSPSGRGVHLYGLGTLHGSGKKKELDEPKVCDTKMPGVEVYDRGRYFTFTGKTLDGSAKTPADCQGALVRLLKKYFPPPKEPTYSPPPKPTTCAAERATLYVDKIPGADAGHGRDMQTFHVACVLVLGFMLSESEALPILESWNTKCKPNTWPEDKIRKELRRTLANANKRDGPRGWLLEDRSYDGDDVDLSNLLSSLLSNDEPIPDEPELDIQLPREIFDNMPCLMRIAYDFTLSTAIKPQPELTLAALITMFGAIFGRRVCDDYGTRSNIMMLALSPSGSGKEHPRHVVKNILHACELDLVNGPERIGSHAGIISSVDKHPVRLFQLDEIGRLLHTMRDPKASHLYNIGTVLMQLFSSANTIWTGDAYADVNKVKTINQPHVCVFGTSVPKGFYSGLTAENLSDGLLARFMVVESSGYSTRRKPKQLELPPTLIEHIKTWSTYDGGNLADKNPRPSVIPKTDEADARHEQYCDEVNDKHCGDDADAASMWARAPEKAAKLALIYACCQAVRQPPTITIEAIDWGRKFTNYSTRLLLQRAGNTVSTSASAWGREKLRAWDKLVDGMSRRDFGRKTPWLRKNERNEILSDWVDSGAIEVVTLQTGSNPTTTIKKTRKEL